MLTPKVKEFSQIALILLKPIKDQLKIITVDNNKEFSLYESVAQVLEIGWYFVHSYSAWQRSISENTNGLIRQYIKKSSDLKMYKDVYISETIQRLIHWLRKRIGFKSPN